MEKLLSRKKPNNSHSQKVISIHKFMIALFLFSAVIGYVISFGKLYLFHIILILVSALMMLGFIKVSRSNLENVKYPFIFLLYCCITLFWTPNVVNGMYYIFYLVCGFSILFLVTNYVRTVDNLDFVYKVLSVFFLINLFIGLLETTGLFRLPIYNRSFNEVLGNRPTGFNYNLNNFGFVLIILFPYFFIYPNRIVKYLSLPFLFWFSISLESKGFFVTILIFFIFYFLLSIKKKNTWYKLIYFTVFLVPFILVLSMFLNKFELTNRSFTAFDSISKGLELMSNGYIDPQDSTSIRALMYLFGIQELIDSKGIGLGIAGIGSTLAENFSFFDTEKGLFSFHNFFLEMLIDLGVIPFFIMIYTYFRLIFTNIKISKKTNNKKMAYYSKATALSLLIAIPASISPSSIIYVFPFWLVLSFSMSVIKLNNSKV